MPKIEVPDNLSSVTRDFEIGKVKGRITIGFLPDGRPILVLIQTVEQPPLVAFLYQAVALLVTVMLENGVDLEEIIKDVRKKIFEPSGPSLDPDVMRDVEILERILRLIPLIRSPQ